MKIKLVILIFVIVIAFQSAIALAAPKQQILIGALFSITGNWSTLGNTSTVAAQIAKEDVNSYFNKIGANLEVHIIVKDTKLVPDLALKRLQELAKEGVQIVVGPQSSAEIAAIRTFAEQNGILILSQSSTAGSLSIPGDNVFRFCPDDKLEGEAIAALMHADGIHSIVPIWRNDPGNAGLESSTRIHFTNSGGTVSSGIEYAADTTDFSSQIQTLESQVRDALAEQDQNTAELGVYLAGFDEVVSILKLAAASSTLSSVRWYGSDGVALSQALLNDSEAAEFASNANYPNPLPGLPSEAATVWRPIVKRIEKETGTAPEAFALGIYDAIQIAARTVALRPQERTSAFVKQNIRDVASKYFGATGWTILNKNGDRRFGTFDFLAIRNVRGSRQWVRVATYDTGSKSLVRD
jgi:branched-chain amino acid transport system substrate-binding protein